MFFVGHSILFMVIQTKNRPVYASLLFHHLSASNIICLTVLGHCYPHDDKDFVRLVTRMNELLEVVGFGAILNCLPALRHLPGDLTHYKFIRKIIGEMKRWVMILFS